MSVSVKVPIKVQKRSGFDKSHHCSLSQHIGKIVPIMVDEIIANTKVHLRFALAGSMAPLATDAYMKCYYDVRAFFVPMRILYGGFESWFSDYTYPSVRRTDVEDSNEVSFDKSFLPILEFDSTADLQTIFARNTLSDYLGFKALPSTLALVDSNFRLSAMPYLAYHKVVNDWYRQPNITRDFFARPSTPVSPALDSSAEYIASMLPYISFPALSTAVLPVKYIEDDNLKLADGVSLLSLRSCNYDYDYFTNALPSAQLNSPMSVASSSSFTIASLRVANSLQQFAELNMLAGSNIVDVLKARYGANLSRGITQRAIYLGGSRIDVGTKAVDNNTGVTGNNVNNPFAGILGSVGGKAVVQGTDLIIEDFVAEEPGYIFVMGSIIPKVTYGSGVRRYLRHYISSGSLADMANPMLQNVGNQPIYAYELDGGLGMSSEAQVFGFTDRYADFMTYEDEVHGLLSYGESLQSFVAQRVFHPNEDLSICTDFLEIPSDALNNISAVGSQVSDYGFYGQVAFDYKISQPLAQYSLPSLQNPAYEHGKSVMVHRGGFRF